MPLALTGTQMTAVLNAARPLSPSQRSAFLAALAIQFSGRSEVGDGELGRALRELQREHFDPPLSMSTPTHRATYRA